MKEQSFNKISGDDALVDPPVPIPNTVVKHQEAESTCLETGWEDRKLPVKQRALALASCESLTPLVDKPKAPCGVLFIFNDSSA